MHLLISKHQLAIRLNILQILVSEYEKMQEWYTIDKGSETKMQSAKPDFTITTTPNIPLDFLTVSK